MPRVMILALALLLAGCSGPTPSQADMEPVRDVNIQGACPADLARTGHCWQDGIDIHLSNVEIRAESHGLGVLLSGQNLTISDTTITGGATGIAIQAAQCPCHVTIRNVTITESDVAIRAGPLASDAGPSLMLHDLAIDQVQVGLDVTRLTRLMLSNATIAASSTGTTIVNTDNVAFSDTTISGAEECVYVNGAEHVHVEALTVRGCGTGAHFNNNEDHALDRVTATNNEVGVAIVGGTFSGKHWTIQDNGGSSGAGISISLAAGNVHDSSIVGNLPVGVRAGPGTVDFTNNWWGSADGAKLALTPEGPSVGPGGDSATREVDTAQPRSSPPNHPTTLK